MERLQELALDVVSLEVCASRCAIHLPDELQVGLAAGCMALWKSL
jgi:hypothetical protein